MSADSSQLVELPHIELSVRRMGKLRRWGYNCREHTFVTSTVTRMLAVQHTRASLSPSLCLLNVALITRREPRHHRLARHQLRQDGRAHRRHRQSHRPAVQRAAGRLRREDESANVHCALPGVHCSRRRTRRDSIASTRRS